MKYTAYRTVKFKEVNQDKLWMNFDNTIYNYFQKSMESALTC